MSMGGWASGQVWGPRCRVRGREEGVGMMMGAGRGGMHGEEQ